MNDPCVEHFVQYLEGEKNASEHTISNYLIDIRQYCEIIWGDDAQPPYKWKEADRFSARKFLVFFQVAFGLGKGLLTLLCQSFGRMMLNLNPSSLP